MTIEPNGYKNLIDENKQLEKRISKLVSENVDLQNALYTEQLNEDETKNYIDRLKQENQKLKNERKWWINEYKNLKQEYKQLKNDLTIDIDEKNNEIIQLKSQRDNWEKEYYEVVEENDRQDEYITQLKTKLLDSSVKEQRLLKILNETDDYT